MRAARRSLNGRSTVVSSGDRDLPVRHPPITGQAQTRSQQGYSQSCVTGESRITSVRFLPIEHSRAGLGREASFSRAGYCALRSSSIQLSPGSHCARQATATRRTGIMLTGVCAAPSPGR